MARTEAARRVAWPGLLSGIPLALVLLLPFLAQGLPLLGVLDAEYALAAAFLLALWGVVAGWRRARAALEEGRGGLDAGPLALGGLLLTLYLLAAMATLTLLVRQCRLDSGPLVFVLMTFPSSLLGLGLGALARARGRTRLRAASWLGFLVLALLVLPPLVRSALLQQAPHSLLTGVWGLVSVFAYRAEEALLRTPTLLHRAGTLLVAALLLAMAEACLRRRAGRKGTRRDLAVFALAAGLLLLLLAGGDRTGFGTGRGGLERHLCGMLEEDGLVLRFDPGHLEPRAARRLLDDALWHRRDLATRLGLGGAAPVTIWVFSSRSLLRGTVGLSYGNLAAPWRAEAVIQASRAGRSPTLRHELVHLLAAAWTPSPLGVPLDPTRTEGLATALEKRLDSGAPYQRPHAAALAAGKLPAIASFIGTRRFWLGGQSVRNAYDLAGSFVGFLLERFGTTPVRRWYSGARIEEAFGLDLGDLDAAWRSRLAEIETGAVEQESAGHRMDEGARRAVHRSRCGRLPACDEEALRREAFRSALAGRRWAEILTFLEDEALVPSGAFGGGLERAWLLELAHRGLGTPEAALEPVEQILEGLPAEDERRARLFEILLRLEIEAGRDEEARMRLRSASASEPDLAGDLGWLFEALQAPDRDAALAVFLETEPLERARRATDLLSRHPDWPGLALWTWRRQLWIGERREVALSLGEKLRADGESIPGGALALLYEDLAREREDDGELAEALEAWRAAESLREDPLPQALAREEQRRLAWRLERAALRAPDRDREGR